MQKRASITLIVTACAVMACGQKAEQPAADTPTATAAAAPATLYDRLGGTAAIASVVDAFVANAGSDTRINKFFSRVAGDTAAMRQFKQKIVDQVCQGTGGPCTYTGLDMKAAHGGMGLTDSDFDAVVENLVKALDGAGVPQKEKDDLLAILGPMRADIVTKK